ncbi:hypothetical protein Bbelb_127660 [Branchiostoma belcheri]|nr:hypothetical protein Bbelb_127660 [Branchiostoma belcheri]
MASHGAWTGKNSVVKIRLLQDELRPLKDYSRRIYLFLKDLLPVTYLQEKRTSDLTICAWILVPPLCVGCSSMTFAVETGNENGDCHGKRLVLASPAWEKPVVMGDFCPNEMQRGLMLSKTVKNDVVDDPETGLYQDEGPDFSQQISTCMKEDGEV